MNWFESIILGIIQGLTEFLPISSSAHVLIASRLFFHQDAGAAFTAIIQFGTEAAVIVYFWKDIVRIIGAWCRSLVGKEDRKHHDVRLGWLIIVGSIPIVVLGLLFKDSIETVVRNLWIVAGTLIVFGILLGIADALGKREKHVKDLTVRDGLLFGLFQALALIPGVSRSGGTIMGGRMLGYDRADAARYSFLLAIPAVIGSGFYEAYQALKGSTPGEIYLGPTILATVISFVVGLAVIRWLLNYLNRGSFAPFVWYRLGLGVVLIILMSTGILDPSLHGGI